MGSINVSSNVPFPIIDISQISSPEHQPVIAQNITEACSTWGFLLLKNHTIPTTAIDHLFSLGHQFFSLPESQKDPWPITLRSIGYIGPLTDHKKDDKASMWFGGPPGSLTTSRHGDELPPFWHEHVQEIQEFKHKCHALVLELLICFALAMNLPNRNFFADKHREDNERGNALRLLHYPSRGCPPLEGGTRMNAHTDSGSVTLLFQRSAGLEVLSPSGVWVPAPCLEDTILVNLGDTMAFWSGRKLRATMHRVTFETVPSGRERQSMAYFCTANPETMLEPLCEDEAGTYETNGIAIEKGLTVGELGTRIMEGIYGSKLRNEDSRMTVKV